jgi:DNA replication and repair protein RecF
MALLLQQNKRKDLMVRHTSIGIHRDDLEFELDAFPIRKFGSQGQQKSFLVALKIAQFEYTFLKKKYKPLLLLDDIFDKLDVSRVEQLMKLVSRNEFGQIFITDTNYERVALIFAEIDVERKMFMVESGQVNEI